MTRILKEVEFGKLPIGTRFISASGAVWFKRSTKSANGLLNRQGPFGREWDNFTKYEIVKVSANE